VLHHEQFMPLSALSPDLHSPIEHMVGTIKGKIRKWARSHDRHSPDLYSAAYWQRNVNAIMEGVAVGAADHCQGSITKWSNCVRIVAANKGDAVLCKVSPQKLAQRVGPRKDWVLDLVEEKGTGGGWAPAAYC
jgi:hypothetical protein